MKITDISPPPVEKKFNLELSENDIQMLGLIAGSISTARISSFFGDESWRLENYPTVTNDSKFVIELHSKIIAVTKTFRKPLTPHNYTL